MNFTKTRKRPLINSHDSWSPLEEVWLGDIYPMTWYDHLSTSIREVFYEITEKTQQDLDTIQKILTGMDITVRRPKYSSIDAYLNHHDQLVKPSICPRDQHVVIGNTLYRTDIFDFHSDPWIETLKIYAQDPDSRVDTSPAQCINGANVVRAGKDIIVDSDWLKDYKYNGEWPDYRVKVLNNGGHLDGCFAILKPGLILANHYFDSYEETFPDWEVLMLDDPTYGAAPSRGYQQSYPIYNGKFWDTTVSTNRSFNQHIIDHALDWVGFYTETYFELNCLVVDEQNVIMLSGNEKLADTLAKKGITVHWVPFRTRSFWDGAMHCLTVDIRRQSSIVDYFPQRNLV